MDRRAALKALGKLILLGAVYPSRLLRAGSTPTRRWILIYDSKVGSNYSELLARAGDFISAANPNWKKDLVLWEARLHAGEIAALASLHGRNTRAIPFPLLIETPTGFSFSSEVQIWTLDWLRALTLRYQDSCYPVSSGWWSVDGDWNPSAGKVRTHLFESPNHTDGHFQSEWLALLKLDELQSVHSDHHREMIHEGKVLWKNVNAECPTTCTPRPLAYTGGDRTIRRGESTTLGGMAIDGQTYQWSPASTLDDPTSSLPTATPSTTTEYTLQARNACGTAIQKVRVTVTP